MRQKIKIEEVTTKIQEGKGIISDIIYKHRLNQQIIVLVNGAMGCGKSYGAIRGVEMFYEKLNSELNIEDWHIIRSKLEFDRALPRCKPGTQLIIEEASVLFNSRRSQTGENVSFNSILEITRKKRIGFWLTFPLTKNVDSTARTLASHKIKFEKVNKKYGFSTARVWKYILDDYSGVAFPKTIKTSVKTRGGKTRAKSVTLVYFKLPQTPGLIERYEKLKDEFIDNHYQAQLAMSEAKQRKKDKQLKEAKEKDLSMEDRNREIILKVSEGKSYSVVAKDFGVSKTSVARIIKDSREEK